MTKSETIYPSRVDWWVAGVLAAVLLTPVGIGVRLTMVSWVLGLVCILFGLLVGALMVRMTFPCRYVLTDEALLVQFGWDEERIPLRRVRDARLSGSILSAPALSMRRVEIVYDGGSIVISPHDRQGFISDLLSRLSRKELVPDVSLNRVSD